MVVLSLALVGSLSQSCDKMQVSVWLAYSRSIPAEILYTGPSVSDLSLWELRQPPGSAPQWSSQDSLLPSLQLSGFFACVG